MLIILGAGVVAGVFLGQVVSASIPSERYFGIYMGVGILWFTLTMMTLANLDMTPNEPEVTQEETQ